MLIFAFQAYAFGCYASRNGGLRQNAKKLYLALWLTALLTAVVFGVYTSTYGAATYSVIASPDWSIHDQLKQIYAVGYGFSPPQKAVLKKGTRLDMRMVLKNDLPGVSPYFTRFCFDENDFKRGQSTVLPAWSSPACTNSSDSGALQIGRVPVDVSFYFTVCGDSSISNEGAYRISIASTAAKSGSNCVIPTNKTEDMVRASRERIDYPPMPKDLDVATTSWLNGMANWLPVILWFLVPFLIPLLIVLVWERDK